MRKMSWMVHLIAAVSLLSLLLVGCSDDDDNGGTGPTNTISQEDQLELLDQLIDLDADTTEEESALGLDILALGIGEINGSFLDGIDESDFEDFFIPGLGKMAPRGQLGASVSFSYNNGWWVITVDSSFSGFGLLYSIQMTDSVRFETAANVAQQIPDDDTETFIERASYDLEMTGAFGGQSFDFDFDFGTGLTVGGLTTTTATINGGTLGTLAAEFQSNDTTGSFTLAIDGTTTNGVIPNFEEEGCPSSGTMDIGLGVDATLITDGSTATAQGTWDIGVTIVNGIATIVFESESFTKTETANLCEEDD
ncbi:MAG: hypothetical protein GF341_02945 [candidate division Zixibacteria bacterium]|nr:hypothetical protein [candidate division Zixibacteria bacterium]